MPICSSPPNGITFSLPFPSFLAVRELRRTGAAAALSSADLAAGSCFLPPVCPCREAAGRRLGARFGCSFFTVCSPSFSPVRLASAVSLFPACAASSFPSAAFFGLDVLRWEGRRFCALFFTGAGASPFSVLFSCPCTGLSSKEAVFSCSIPFSFSSKLNSIPPILFFNFNVRV